MKYVAGFLRGIRKLFDDTDTAQWRREERAGAITMFIIPAVAGLLAGAYFLDYTPARNCIKRGNIPIQCEQELGGPTFSFPVRNLAYKIHYKD